MQTVRLPQSELEKHLVGRPRHVFISGASRGIGEAVARLLGEDPHRISLGARSYNRMLGIAMDLGQERCFPVRLDLGDTTSIDEAIVASEQKFGPIDVLVANAGINLPTPIDDTTDEGRQRFRRVLDVNLTGTYFLAQRVIDHMPNGGRIVFVGSVLARMGVPGASGYVASKHALQGLVRAMAVELAPRNIRVNMINPGWVDTQMAHESLQRIAQASGETLQQTTAKMMSGQLIRRMIKPSEVAGYVKFLLSPAGDAITGQGLDLSCGQVLI
ncbi:MAG: SDR family oxidoreductase [Myxococcales bacterium]|nr:SDR family oxidoreductase [Myxococcales bacterium]